jgi:hypothetical protein
VWHLCLISIVTMAIMIVTKTTVVPNSLMFCLFQLHRYHHHIFINQFKCFTGMVAVLFAMQPLATNHLASKLWSSSMQMSTYDRLTACLLWKGQEKKGTLGVLHCLSFSVRSNCNRTSVWKWSFPRCSHSVSNASNRKACR